MLTPLDGVGMVRRVGMRSAAITYGSVSGAIPSEEIQEEDDSAQSAVVAGKDLLMLYVASAGAFLGMVSNLMFLPAIGKAQEDLDTSVALISAALTAYMFVQGFQPLIAGPVADVVGRKTPMLVGHVLFIAASITAACAPSVYVLILARAVEGIAACTLLVVGQAQVGDVFGSSEALGWAMGVYSLSRMSAALCGPIIGGVICKYFGWRATYVFGAALDVIFLVLSVIYIPETLNTPHEERPKLSWTSPFKPLRAMNDMSIGILCLANSFNHALIYVVTLALALFGPTLTQDQSVIGLFFTPATIGTVVASLLSKRLLKNGEFRGILVGMLLNISGSVASAWSILYTCADETLIPNDLPAHPLGDNITLVNDKVEAGKVFHLADPLSASDLNYRLHHNVVCAKWSLLPFVIAGVANFAVGFGGALMMVASMTYMSKARPKERGSLAASQRVSQQVRLDAAVSIHFHRNVCIRL